MDGVGGAGVFEVAVIGDVGFVGGVVLGFVRADVFVDLVDCFEGGGGVEGGEGGGAGAFAWAVVHDGDGGGEGANEEGVVTGLQAVVIDLVEVDFAREVVRGDEAFLDVPGEVATVEEAEVAEAEEEDDAVGVVGFVLGLVGGE